MTAEERKLSDFWFCRENENENRENLRQVHDSRVTDED